MLPLSSLLRRRVGAGVSTPARAVRPAGGVVESSREGPLPNQLKFPCILSNVDGATVSASRLVSDPT